MAGAVAAGLLLVSRRLGLVAAVAALLMAFSRVYIAAHYPWDVLAGLALGAAVAPLGWLLLRRPLTALTGWLRSLPGVRAGFAEQPLDGSTTSPPWKRPQPMSRWPWGWEVGRARRSRLALPSGAEDHAVARGESELGVPVDELAVDSDEVPTVQRDGYRVRGLRQRRGVDDAWSCALRAGSGPSGAP